MARPIYKWHSKKVDESLDQLMSELGRVPTYGEFIAKYPGAMDAIKSGRYAHQITTWKEYVTQRGLRNVKQGRVPMQHDLPTANKWSPEKIDAVFDQMTLKLGRVPKYIEFRNKFGGAMSAIVYGRYDSSIKSFGD